MEPVRRPGLAVSGVCRSHGGTQGCDLPLPGAAVTASDGGSMAARVPPDCSDWEVTLTAVPLAWVMPLALRWTVLNSADNNILDLMALPYSKPELRVWQLLSSASCATSRVLHSPGHQVILRSLSNMFGCSNQTPVGLFSPFHFTRFTVFPLKTPFFADDAMFSHTMDLLLCGKPQSHLRRAERTLPFMSEKKPNPELGCTRLSVL